MAKKITTVEQLNEAIEDDGSEFFIALAGGVARSSKRIQRDGELYLVTNEIDDTEQDLTEAQLFDEKLTHIGLAMREGTFFAY